MKSSVIIFPGSNCDRDMDVALNKFGFKNQMVWHNDKSIPKSDLIVLPGGFSYGDYLRCGSIASKSKIIKSVVDFAHSGGLVLGICNGFQILTEANLLPGTLIMNKSLKFICKEVQLKTINKTSLFTKEIKEDVIKLPIAHKMGNYVVSDSELTKIINNDQIAFKYCSSSGICDKKNNPNGSVQNIAGILSKNKKILGMMPHPERHTENAHGCQDGYPFFEGLLVRS